MTNTISPVDSGSKKIELNPTLETKVVRNISSLVDKANEISHYYLVCTASEVLKFATDKNLRDFYGAEGSAKTLKPVHNEIKNSFIHNYEKMKLLHSGFTVIADEASEDKTRTLMNLTNAQLVNGAQSQGVIRQELETLERDGLFNSEYHKTLISIELIVTKDRELRNDICNARNSQNPVHYSSLMESRFVFTKLNTKMGLYNQDWSVSGRETTETGIPVARLIQITRLFLPDSLMEENKVKQAYVGSLTCLRKFEEWHNENNEIYNFMTNFAPIAWTEYLKWNSHKGWAKNQLREDYTDKKKKPIGKRLENGDWIDIHQGVLFPLLRGLHVFVEPDGKGGWKLNPRKDFKEDGMIKKAIQIYREEYNNDPQTMGKDGGSYKTMSAYAFGMDFKA